MKTKNKILVAVDFEDQSLIAFKYAKYFAELLDFEIDLMAVIEESNFISKLFSPDEYIVKINKEVENKLQDIYKNKKNSIKINTHIKYGKPYEKIIELANEINPAFIYMGKSELPKYKRAFVGSNAMHVILESNTPVITIRGNYDIEFYKKEHKEIIVPLDFEYLIHDQLSASIDIAKKFHAKLRFLTIQTEGGKGKEMDVLTKLGNTKKAISNLGIECETELIYSNNRSIASVINEQAIFNKAFLIIIMARKENKISDYILGSNALDIISSSDIPILTVQPWDDEKGSSIFNDFLDPLSVFKK